MRVLVVSAHYPPDFVSGGTLVPQRLARGLRDRGHDVHVYAGSIDPARPPLSTWAERDETGLPVRWIAVHRFIAWDSERNTHNPAVTRDFAAYLQDVRPDVVHLHSVQALGGGLVPAARAAGARVVVTMHDFWWVCGRQFLATREPRPCCLVVDAGTCPCEVDHDWLLRRNGALHRDLEAADLLLAPSRSAAEVLRANGLGRVEVDDNGLPPWRPQRHPPRPDGLVRLLFTGGSNPLKGWPVLAGALPYLPTTGWRLSAYGVPAPDDDPMPDAVADRVTLHPAYLPSELGAVLAQHDVLVVPSVMRETQSVVTREALQAGLTVVCTDTLGPEEVVTDGVNGRIVPAADSQALGQALAELVTDPDLLRPDPQLRLRTVDEQVGGLEDRYARLLGEPRAGASGTLRTWAPRRVLFVCGIEGAPLRYRAELPAEALRLHGVRTDVRAHNDEAVPRLAHKADAVVLYRVPATPQILGLLADVRSRPEPPPVLADIDDLIFDPSLRGTLPGLAVLSAADQDLWWQGVRRYRTTIEHADAFVTTTPLLRDRAADLTGLPSYVLPNGVGLVMGRLADAAVARQRSPGPLRVGYFSGTNTHDHDWAVAERAVVAAVRDHPDAELWLGGHLRASRALLALGTRVRRLPFLPWTELVGVLRDLDVNLAPLALGDTFNEAKSAIKWLEAALVETPTVASPTAPFSEAIGSGTNGLLAATDAEWYEGVSALLTDPLLRRRLGTRARRDALLRFSPHLQADRYLQILAATREYVRVHGPRHVTTGWPDEVVDEEWRPHPLEPYATADPREDLRVAALRLRRRAGTMRRAGVPYVAAARHRVGRAARAAGFRRVPPGSAPR
ncbi:MAG TPA: glycosyltransferase [Mycobacteriales bacterium]